MGLDATLCGLLDAVAGVWLSLLLFDQMKVMLVDGLWNVLGSATGTLVRDASSLNVET